MYDDYSELAEVRKATSQLLNSIKMDLIKLKLGIALEQTKYEKYKTIDSMIDYINFNLGVNDYQLDKPKETTFKVLERITGAF